MAEISFVSRIYPFWQLTTENWQLRLAALDTNKQAVKFFYIAKGSSAEVLTQAIIALEIGYIDKEKFKHIEKECKAISGMLTRLIQARSKGINWPLSPALSR